MADFVGLLESAELDASGYINYILYYIVHVEHDVGRWNTSDITRPHPIPDPAFRRRRSDPQAPPVHANRHKMQVLHTAIFAQYWSNRKTKTAQRTHSGRHIASHANDNGRVTAVRALDSHLSTPTRYETGQKGRTMGSKHK